MDGDSGVTGLVTQLVTALGYVGVAVAVMLEVFVPLVPSTVVLPLAGLLAARAEMSFAGALAAATLGSLAGALGFYGLGRWVGAARLHGLVDRLGRVRILTHDDLDRGTAWLSRHGATAVLLARFVPPIRSPVSIAAGIARVPLLRFVPAVVLGSSVWNAGFLGIGWVLGERWQEAQQYAGWIQAAAIGIGVVGTAAFAWYRWRQQRRRGRG